MSVFYSSETMRKFMESKNRDRILDAINYTRERVERLFIEYLLNGDAPDPKTGERHLIEYKFEHCPEYPDEMWRDEEMFGLVRRIVVNELTMMGYDASSVVYESNGMRLPYNEYLIRIRW